MSQARGGAIIAMATVLLLLLHCNIGSTETFIVGDFDGWTYGVQNWTQGKSFKTGDVLEFNYDPYRHNVILVDQAAHDSCKPPSDAPTYQTGNDSFALTKGKHFYICGAEGHCSERGMKLEINAE